MKRWEHQEKALQFLRERNFGALFMDMGTGKSKVMIDLLQELSLYKVLIVCPKSVCVVWLKQLETHMVGTYSVLDLSRIPGQRRREELDLFWKTQKPLKIAILNYESVWREPLKGYLLKNPPQALICDESHRIKSPSSAVSRFMFNLGKRVVHKYCLTGTPLPHNPLDIYGQYRFMCPEVFGTNFGKFSRTYANIDDYWGYPQIKGFKNLEELSKKIYEHAFRVELKEVMPELPPVQDIEIEYDMSTKAQKAYTELRTEGCLEFEEGILTISAVVTLIGRLQQICSGYAPVFDDNGIQTDVHVDEGRIEVLKDLLEGIREEEPVVVFCKYRKDIKNVTELCEKMNRVCREISGKKNQYLEFKDNPEGVLVVQISSGGSGLDLTEAKYCVYYTLTHSLGDYQQSRARLNRPGQKRQVTYYTIIARHRKYKTIDEQIIAAHRTGQNIVDVVMNSISG